MVALGAPAAHADTTCPLDPPLVGVTADGHLVYLTATDPGDVRVGPRVTGLRTDDERIIAVSSDPWGWPRNLWAMSDSGRVYRLNARSGVASGGAMDLPDPPLPAGTDVALRMNNVGPIDYPQGLAYLSTGERWRFNVDGTGRHPTERTRTRDVSDPGAPADVGMGAFADGAAIDADGESLWRLADWSDLDGFVRRAPLAVDVRSPATLVDCDMGYEDFENGSAGLPAVLLTATPAGDSSFLHRIDWETGVVAPLGTIGYEGLVNDVVVEPGVERMAYFDDWMSDVFEGSADSGFELRRVNTDLYLAIEMDVVFEEYDGTAKLGEDFASGPMTLRLEPGQETGRFAPPVIDDDEWEPVSEQFQVRATEIRVDGERIEQNFRKTLVLHDDEWYEACMAGATTCAAHENPPDPRLPEAGSPPGPAKPDKPRPPHKPLAPSAVTPDALQRGRILRRGVPVTIRCATACTVRLTLQTGIRRARAAAARALARRAVRLPRGGSRRVTLRVRRADRGRVRRGLPLTLRALGRDRAGRATGVVRRVRVR